jgi:hypothetical protein
MNIDRNAQPTRPLWPSQLDLWLDGGSKISRSAPEPSPALGATGSLLPRLDQPPWPRVYPGL